MSKCRKDFKQWWAESGIIAGEGSMDAAEEAWNARVPEGYVVVPRRPTEKMKDIGYHKAIQLGYVNEIAVEIVYKAMIASAEEGFTPEEALILCQQVN